MCGEEERVEGCYEEGVVGTPENSFALSKLIVIYARDSKGVLGTFSDLCVDCSVI